MPSLDQTLQSLIETTCSSYNLPGLSVALWQNDTLHQAVCGRANLATGLKITPDTIFQIGSITKVMTACLVMQLVDEGRVDLDAPVRHYLRDFLVADAQATLDITVRQLLNHTSGMAGDFFPDDNGHEGNLIARYVDRCNLLPQVNPPGEQYSYSNSAFVIAGRLVELVRGISWYQAMQDYIFTPLGMDHAIADPKELIRYRAAMGHLRDSDAPEGWVLSDKPWLALGMAPCGSSPTMSAGDLVTFARAHLNGGLNAKGERWLSADSVSAMQQPQIHIPQTCESQRGAAGLGWRLNEFVDAGVTTFGHLGATRGFYSALLVFPEFNAVYSVLMNSVHPEALSGLQASLLALVSGVKVAEPAADTSRALGEQHLRYIGHYESLDKRIKVWLEEGQLKARMVYRIDPLPTETLNLYPLDGQRVAAFNVDGRRCPNLVFMGGGNKQAPDYLFDGSRLNPRICQT